MVKYTFYCLNENDRFKIKDKVEKGVRDNQKVIEEIKKAKCSNMLGWKCLTTQQDSVVSDIKEYCNKAREKFDSFVVLGVGGSALGAKAIFNTLCPCTYNSLDKKQRKAPKFYVLDNIDPIEINEVVQSLDLKNTLINVVSKSGTTTESMAQFLAFWNLIVDCVGQDKAKEHFVFTTDQDKGLLSVLEKQYGIKAFYIPGGVGGRFSVLSPVGLLPACMLNVDIEDMLKGARDAQLMCEKDAEENPALKKAVLEYELNKIGVNMVVTMPYTSKLKEYSYWYAQLLGESIGKEMDRCGNKVKCGLTPVSALGTTDQHSQLQLYMEGPHDKLLVCIKVKDFEKKYEVKSDAFNMPELEHLKNFEFGKLINMERKSTLCGLENGGIPYMEVVVDRISPYTLGELFMLGMYEIAFLGELYNVDAYNQPGVEYGKRATLANLGVEKYKEYLDICKFIED